MIKFANILFGTLVVLGFSQCKSSQATLTDNPPFYLGESTIEAWTAGDANEITGKNIYLGFSAESLKENFSFDSLYYNGQVVALEHYRKGNFPIYLARFLDQDTKVKDIVMHADPKKEFGNMPPTPVVKPPFDVAEGQALLTYTYNDKKGYYLIKELKEVVAIHYKQNPIIYK
ncbi:hypothetical protein [Joostella sp. CR20]|uniref:hypothetical protein n=1 Tax=Joostella sp. CR20 TaxID=2804312 RepID=UPI00313D0C2D